MEDLQQVDCIREGIDGGGEVVVSVMYFSPMEVLPLVGMSMSMTMSMSERD